VSRPVRTGSPPSLGANSIHPCQPFPGLGLPQARARYVVPSGATTGCWYSSSVSAISQAPLATVLQNAHRSRTENGWAGDAVDVNLLPATTEGKRKLHWGRAPARWAGEGSLSAPYSAPRIYSGS